MNDRTLTCWTRRLALGLLLVGTLLVSACTRDERAQDDLYQALGERSGIDRMVAAIFVRVYADERIAVLFKDTDRPNLEQLVAEQICFEAGGPCTYTGRSMQESHSGLGISHREFDAFVEDFILGMQDAGVPYRVQNRVLRIFAPMRPEVIDQ